MKEPIDKQEAEAKTKAQLKEVKETGAADVNETTTDAASTQPEASDPKVTKAGKRSAKALREEAAEEERKAKAAAKTEEPQPKKVVKHVPNLKKRRGARWLAASQKIDRQKFYELDEAINLVKETAKVKFDPSVELHINLGVDPRQADQMVRASVVLPAGTGKSLRVAVFAPDEKQAAAKKAGADIVGEDELLKEIEKGKIDFDMLIATPDGMSKLGRVAKVLGPKGLMPNPKSGTVTNDIERAVKEAKAGKVEFRIDRQSIIHQAIGKASFKQEDLTSNTKALIDAVMKAKPAAAKGTYVKAISLSSTMGPGLKLNTQSVIAAATAKK